MLYNIYCDETCHLENDNINVMALGAISCPTDKVHEINQRIKELKKRNGISKSAELKWTKVSPAKVDVYMDLVNYFFDDDDIHFRALVIPDKSKLDHKRFNQTHDDWYYKMYFDMLKVIINPSDTYQIYIDIKDSHSYEKAQTLRTVCSNSIYDFSKSVIKKLQPIRSDEVQIMQLVDIILGAIGYANRQFPDGFKRSEAKQELVELIRRRSRYSLTKSTLYKEEKMNLFIWDAKENI